jgi:metal-responsive CopG/Arc/MetJ family transcriptional regulator
MAVRKIAISVPEDVVRQVDRAARRARLTRSAFITDLLRRGAAARSDAEVTRRVNEVFADPELANEQVRASEDFLGAGSRRRAPR